ncbi:hypothetical protein YPPY47_1019, partial [Yersinia pestis PY-47]
MAGLRISF